MMTDLTHVLRAWRRAPAVWCTASLILGLAIGTTTTVFSVANAVLLRPLPYADPDRLVFAFDVRSSRALADLPFSSPTYFDFRESMSSTMEDVAAINTSRGVLPGKDGMPVQVRLGSATSNFFSMLGIGVEHGRSFTEADAPSGRPSVQEGVAVPTVAPVLLSWEYWRQRYGGDPGVVGQAIFPGGPQIVGILARGFELHFPPRLNLGTAPDIWFVTRLNRAGNRDVLDAGRVVARLRAGVPLAAAQRNADAIGTRLRGESATLAAAGFSIRLEPMHHYTVADARPAILVVTAAAVVLLLIACANVTNLLLVRSYAMHRDMALRLILGATWQRLLRQALIQAGLLAALAAGAGVLFAWGGIQALLLAAPANLPRATSVRLDVPVLVFAVLIAALSAAMVSILPALTSIRASRDSAALFRATGVANTPRHARLIQTSVVVAQVAVCFTLLIGTGLMVRSFIELKRTELGYRPDGLLIFSLLIGRLPTPEQRLAFTRSVMSNLRSLPGVSAVTAAGPFPLADTTRITRWGTEEAAADPSRFRGADYQVVLPGYFEALGVPLIEGRVFTDADNTPQSRSIVIDQTLAAAAFPGDTAVGKRLLIRIGGSRVAAPGPPECGANCEWADIIGVVAHERAVTPMAPGRNRFYVTDGFMGHGNVNRWAIRTSADAASYGKSVREALTRINPGLVPMEVETMRALVTRAESPTRFSLQLMAILGGMALVLAVVGVYSVLSTTIAQRRSEIGVRMALGSSPGGALRLILGHGLRIVIAGVAIGLVAAIASSRLMKSMLVGVNTMDPLTYLAVTATFVTVAMAACCLPARRAATVDPATTLRN